MTEKETESTTPRRVCMGPDGAARIAAERQRQKAKWTAAHDDEHGLGLLARAAAVVMFGRDGSAGEVAAGWAPVWAYNLFDDNRGDYARRLEIAGALLASELDVALRWVHRDGRAETPAPVAAADVWLTSTDEERWPGSGEEYASREEAIAGGPKEHDLSPDDVFFVGRKQEVAIHSNWGDHVIEQLGLNAYDGAGEAAEEWPDNTKEQEAELDDEITRVIDAWLDRHGLHRTFFTLDKVSKHHAPEVEEQAAAAPGGEG